MGSTGDTVDGRDEHVVVTQPTPGRKRRRVGEGGGLVKKERAGKGS